MTAKNHIENLPDFEVKLRTATRHSLTLSHSFRNFLADLEGAHFNYSPYARRPLTSAVWLFLYEELENES